MCSQNTKFQSNFRNSAQCWGGEGLSQYKLPGLTQKGAQGLTMLLWCVFLSSSIICQSQGPKNILPGPEHVLGGAYSVACSLKWHSYIQYCLLFSVVLEIWNTVSQMCSVVFKLVYILPITSTI